MPICQGQLSNGEQCSKITKADQIFCRWHNPEDNSWREIYEELNNCAPKSKVKILFQLIEDHPENRVELPERDGIKVDLSDLDLSDEVMEELIKSTDIDNFVKERFNNILERADLEGADLTGAKLRNKELLCANLSGASLNLADLSGANLGGADLSHAFLYGTDLSHAFLYAADLSNVFLDRADLSSASLYGADLSRAYLYEANLSRATLDGAKLSGATLKYADLQGASLGFANLSGAILDGANLSCATLKHADLSGASLVFANLSGASLERVNLSGTVLMYAKLTNAILRNTKLHEIDLTVVTDLSGIHISTAWLDRTRIHQKQIDQGIGEEINREYAEAKRGYLLLKQNFEDLGDYNAASWAYIKERKMEKLETKAKIKPALSNREWNKAWNNLRKYLIDLLVEWLCEYGENVGRVIGWMAGLLFIIGPLLFSMVGGFTWSGDLVKSYTAQPTLWHKFWYTYQLYLLYTLDTLTTASFSGLVPSNNIVKLFSGFFAIAGIFLAGLLGFVAGNRIRHS